MIEQLCTILVQNNQINETAKIELENVPEDGGLEFKMNPKVKHNLPY
jgi:hypothetical protein